MEAQKTLTPRQYQVIRLRAWGLSAAEIGQEIGIAEATVEVHTYEAYKRLGCSGLIQALLTLGWLVIPEEEGTV